MSKKEKLQKIIEEECAFQIKDARKRIRGLLEKATLSLMGLESNGSRVEIDHCNSRNSVLIDAFRECAIEEAQKVAKGFSPDTATIVSATSTFNREFSRQFNKEIIDLARKRAKSEAETIINSLKLNVDDFLL